MTPITRAASSRNSNGSGLSNTPITTTPPNESKLSGLTAEDDAKMSSSIMSDSINLSVALPKIPPYLSSTAYGERFHSFLDQEDGLGDIYMNRNYPKNSAAAVAAAVYLKGSSNDDEHRHLDVSPSEFNLPQIFPSRRAAELDALGMWQYPRPPLSSSAIGSDALYDMYMRTHGRRIYRDGNVTVIDIGRGNGGSSNGSGSSNANSSSTGNSIITPSASSGSGSSITGTSSIGGGTSSRSYNIASSVTFSSDGSVTSTGTGNDSSSPTGTSTGISISTPTSNSILRKLSPDKPSTPDSITPRKDIGLPHLPTRWTKTDVDQNVSIDNDGTKVDCSVNSKNSASSSSSLHSVVVLKTDYPIPPLTGIFYYEVEVIEHGLDDFISVGFCDIDAGLTKVPGLDSRTWGYHGDDGRISAGQSQSKPFGPKIGVGDIIGCGINFSKNCIFYTKNGLPLGTAFQDVKGVLFPCIGLKSGEIIQTNFGYEEFRFDIEKFVDGMKKRVLNQVQYSKEAVDMINEMIGLEKEKTKNWDFIKDLVASYFDHVGYLETAKAFEKERKIEEKAIGEEGQEEGEEEEANDSMDIDDQDKDKKELKLDILNRQRIRSYILEEDIDGALKLLNVFYPTVLEDNYLIKFKLLCRKFVSLVRKSIPKEGEDLSTTSTASTSTATSLTHHDFLNSAIQYGQDLRKEYKNDSTTIVTTTLSTIFSLLAYEDPYSSPELSYILSKDELIPLAEEVNSAILVSQGKPAVPSLQKLAQHTTQLVWELSDQEYNTANLLNVKNDFLDG